jgi:hypothetical protein
MDTATETKKNVQLADAEDLGIGKDEKDSEDEQQKIVSLWTSRFTRAENFRKPYVEKWLRMYKLYRAYRDQINYAYQTSVMPPIGFEVIETIKPRLASSSIKIHIYPTKREDLNNPAIKAWDGLVEYDMQVMEFDDKKILWINAMLLYGNGTGQLTWDGKNPYLEIVDNWLLYVDPQAQNRLKNSRWEIKQSFKDKAVLKDEEDKRGTEEKLYSLITNWEDLDGKAPTGDDPRRQRYEINTKKMGQIDDGRQKKSDIGPSSGSSTPDKDTGGERQIEIWECWDHITGKLQTIFNREKLARNDENPYMKINKGRVFYDLPDISLNWEYYAMAHLEPVETTIHELADSRNQAMDDITYMLDPIRKVKKGKGYKAEDIKHSPGAIWYLENTNDVTIERPAEVSRMWVEKDTVLRREVQTSLALSEYTQGIPKSSQEPSSKVELLLMQSNIRFSILVRQMEITYTELTNAIIQMNQEFLDEDLAYRILGKKFRFGEFKQSDKEVIVDAWVDVEPKKEKSPEQESTEVMNMYKMFVVDDKPDVQNPEEVKAWKRKKQTLQRLIVEKLGYGEYEDELVPDIPEPKPAEQEVNQNGQSQKAPSGPAEGIADNPVPELLKREVPSPEDLLPPEADIVEPPAATPETAPRQGFLQRLMAARKRRQQNA